MGVFPKRFPRTTNEVLGIENFLIFQFRNISLIHHWTTAHMQIVFHIILSENYTICLSFSWTLCLHQERLRGGSSSMFNNFEKRQSRREFHKKAFDTSPGDSSVQSCSNILFEVNHCWGKLGYPSHSCFT